MGECPACKAYIPWNNLPLSEKIKAHARSLWGIGEMAAHTMQKYGPLFPLKGAYFWDTWIQDARECIQKYEDYPCSEEDHAVIMVNNTEKSLLYGHQNSIVLASGPDLLIHYFVSSSTKFKLYNCHSRECFIDALRTSPAQHVWIFGHGTRHSVSFGNGCVVTFCELKDAPKRDFIAQLHCCHGTGMTLWEYLSKKPGIFTEGWHHYYQNREEIKDWIALQQKGLQTGTHYSIDTPSVK